MTQDKQEVARLPALAERLRAANRMLRTTRDGLAELVGPESDETYREYVSVTGDSLLDTIQYEADRIEFQTRLINDQMGRMYTNGGVEDTDRPAGPHRAGKLGPWAREGCRGERFVGVYGPDGALRYERVLAAEKAGPTWRSVLVKTKSGEALIGCNANIYV